MKDLIDELHAVTRTVSKDTLPAGAAQVVALAREYPAALEEVWDAMTDPARVVRWFLPLSGDLRVGGTYQLEGNAGGEIRVCDPPRHLQVTWIAGPPPGREDSSIVDVRLEGLAEDRTRLELVHTAVVPPEMWDQYGPGAVGVGWDMTVLGLGMHLAGVEMDPRELETDPAIQKGMTACSEWWGEAYERSGATPETAAAAVAAVTAFYVPPE